MNALDSPFSTPPSGRLSLSPSEQAATFLLRFSFIIFASLFVGVALFSRWALVVFVPIGVILIFFYAFIGNKNTPPLKLLITRISSPAGLASVLLLLWALLSLAWSPARPIETLILLKIGGLFIFGTLGVLSLPVVLSARNLHGVTFGFFLGALLVAYMIFAAPFLEGGRLITRTPPYRASLLLSCSLWMIFAWLHSHRVYVLNLLILFLVGAISLFSPQKEAILPFFTALLTLPFLIFFFNKAEPIRKGIALFLGLSFALLFLLAPVVALWFSPADSTYLPHPSLWREWGEILGRDPLSLITGAGYGASSEWFVHNKQAPPLLLSLWFDLGLLGVSSVIFLIYSGFLMICTRFHDEIAPFACVTYIAVLMCFLFSPFATQAWWLNGVIFLILLMVAVDRGRHKAIPLEGLAISTSPTGEEFPASEKHE